MDFIFQTYADLVEPMKAYYSGLKPLEEAEYDMEGKGVKIRYAACPEEKQKQFRITYNADMRTKACDTLRALLPIATKTNVGIFGNGRFFQNVITTCYTSDIPEVQDIGKRTHTALDHIIPRYVKRAHRNAYLVQVDGAMRKLTAELLGGTAAAPQDDVTLLGRSVCTIEEAYKKHGATSGALHAAMMEEEDNLVIAMMLYPYASHPLEQVRNFVRGWDAATKDRIIATYIGDRKTRRDRPGRALEAGYPYTFDLCTDFGTYKDLERHRMATQSRQKYTPMLGFVMPEDLVITGHEDKVRACVAKAQELYELLKADFPHQASYATLHGSQVRWTFACNDREAMHLTELRSAPQGHPLYRKVAQQMHAAIAQRHPWRGAAMKFVDYNDYFWARGDAEARQRVKEAALEKAQS
jgi:thymidylate synthase ThyX